jgi:transposase InsO family protein
MPNRAWKVISLDFIEGLPLSGGSNNCILVVVDCFSKYARFPSLKIPFTTVDVAKVFLAQACKLHGMPAAMVSDRDQFFTSLPWNEHFKLAKVDLHLSSAYHPQSNGQIERVN